jgi:methionine-rich copper-binding protein CopC
MSHPPLPAHRTPARTGMLRTAGGPSAPRRSGVPRRAGGLRFVAALVTAAALALPAALLPAAPVQAHDELAASSPASGATVTTVPHSITLTFDEPVLDYGTSAALIVTGPGGSKRHFETTCPRIDGRAVSAPVELGASGRYTVTWRVVSDDGHPVSDSFSFTLDRPAGTEAAAGSATGPACGSGTTTGEGSGAAASGTVPPMVWALVGVGGGLVVVLLLVVVTVAVRQSRRPAKAGTEAGSGPA